ncbi:MULTISPECIES: hypothetical protein [Paenibacillus]|uniref:hypothetical protein n=1 Tax=Paenibacillus TaxID=44249 RepID=UPI00096E31E3|nr:hypothetical protein [Paenibacillus odorifer]OMD18504.1 hypothetical protein BJP50_14335 [Paenibacillus odorifer]
MNITDINIEVVSRVLERNTSRIEKMEAKIKLSRMLSEVTIFTVIILGLSALSYYLFNIFDFRFASWLISFIPVSLLYIKKIPKVVSVCILFLTLFIISGSNAITNLVLLFPFNIKTINPLMPSYISLCLVLCVISSILLWYFVQLMVETIRIKYFKTVILEIKLIGEPPQLYRLINITRRGDYIVNTMRGKNNSEREVLLNRRNILMVTYITEKENENVR